MSNQYRSVRDANKFKKVTSFFEEHENLSYRRARTQNGGCPEGVLFMFRKRFVRILHSQNGVRGATIRVTQTVVPDPKASREELSGVRIP